MSSADGTKPTKKRFHAGFDDILGKLRTVNSTTDATGASQANSLDGARLAKLLDKHFERLDPNRNGITREEITQALLMKQSFSEEEYAMLELIGFYFDTIANMVDDEPGKESVITRSDKDVLNQFLLHGNLTLEELHRWRLEANATGLEEDQ